jgi:ompA/motB domain protein
VTVKKESFELPSKWESLRRRPGGWAFLNPAANLTLVEEQFRYLPSDYVDSNGGYLPLSNLVVSDLVAGDTRYLPVLWPNLGTDVVTLDLPGGSGTYGSPVSARLTDIPVVDA